MDIKKKKEESNRKRHSGQRTRSKYRNKDPKGGSERKREREKERDIEKEDSRLDSITERTILVRCHCLLERSVEFSRCVERSTPERQIPLFSPYILPVLALYARTHPLRRDILFAIIMPAAGAFLFLFFYARCVVRRKSCLFFVPNSRRFTSPLLQKKLRRISPTTKEL